MLYFRNLTAQVDELRDIERVDVLALPYCPANRKWLEQSALLVERFRPDVTMIHHFDNFMNPFTLYKYMNLDSYQDKVSRALDKQIEIPVLFLPQLIGLAFGLAESALGLKRHVVSAAPVLDRLPA